MKDVANANCTVAHSTGSTTSGGSLSITTPPSLKVKPDGAGVYKGTIEISFTGGSSSWTNGGTGVITPGTVSGTGSIDPTATKVNAEGSKVIRKGDSGSLTLSGTFVPSAAPSTPVPSTPMPSTNIEISDAGQDKVSGE